jgi:alanine racemase
MIRPGYLVYGLGLEGLPLPLAPALAWKSRVAAVLPARRGQALGYDRNFRPERDTRVAIVAAGYADGYPRALSNLAQVLIRGRRARVVGLVAMDQLMAEVGHLPEVERGDEGSSSAARARRRSPAASWPGCSGPRPPRSCATSPDGSGGRT